MEQLRSKLHDLIDINGLDYKKLIEADMKLHDEINKKMKEQLRGKLC